MLVSYFLHFFNTLQVKVIEKKRKQRSVVFYGSIYIYILDKIKIRKITAVKMSPLICANLQ